MPPDLSLILSSGWLGCYQNPSEKKKVVLQNCCSTQTYWEFFQTFCMFIFICQKKYFFEQKTMFFEVFLKITSGWAVCRSTFFFSHYFVFPKRILRVNSFGPVARLVMVNLNFLGLFFF